nr:MAG TPA: hypothetical protein [Caudoviricetes sp.]
MIQDQIVFHYLQMIQLIHFEVLDLNWNIPKSYQL